MTRAEAHSHERETQDDSRTPSKGRLSSLLRMLGALLLLVSSSSFLLTSWERGSDLLRYAILSGHTLSLFVFALYVGSRLKETKTARVLLWTATAIVPVMLAALGGLLYSRFSLDPDTAKLPQIATWIAPNAVSAVLTLVLSIPIVLLVARATARVLSPGLARSWTRVFVPQLAFFLVPVRTPSLTGILCALAMLAPLTMELRVFRETEAARTVEGRLLRALLWSAPLMIAVRTVSFYEPGGLFFGALLLSAGVVVALLQKSTSLPQMARQGLEGFAIATIALGALLLSLEFSPRVMEQVSFLPAVLGALLACRLAPLTGRAWSSVVSIIGAILSALVLLLSNSAWVELTVFIFFSTLLCVHVWERQLLPAIASGIVALGAPLSLFRDLVGFEQIALWQVLSGLGLVAFASAVFVEKYLPRIGALSMGGPEQTQRSAALPEAKSPA